MSIALAEAEQNYRAALQESFKANRAKPADMRTRAGLDAVKRIAASWEGLKHAEGAYIREYQNEHPGNTADDALGNLAKLYTDEHAAFHKQEQIK